MKRYKGYDAHVVYDAEAEIFHGSVPNIRGAITFEGTSVDELVTAFHDSVDLYLELCERNGVEPAKPFSGNFVVRIDPGLHAQLAAAAATAGVSLNSWVSAALEGAVATGSSAQAMSAAHRARTPKPSPRTSTVQAPSKSGKLSAKDKAHAKALLAKGKAPRSVAAEIGVTVQQLRAALPSMSRAAKTKTKRSSSAATQRRAS